jgi:superfamily II DNA or RNA helicase
MARRFTRKQRTELWLASHGMCAICGGPLPEFHADHIKPWSRGGSTINNNGQATCPACNLAKGGNMLRTHQTMFVEVCRQIKADEALRKVIALVCPGGGKSGLPVIAAHELIPYVADGIAWIAPRSNLRKQAETAFTDGWMRSILGHTNEIRIRSNEADLLLGKIGYATTYQSLIAARSYRVNPHIELFNQRRMILFLDEPQHVALDEEFYDAVKPLVEKCAVLVMASGVLSRNDNKRVGFLNYLPKDRQGRYLVDLTATRQQAVIKYGLRDATREHAIIKIEFVLHDCAAEWETKNEDGEVTEGQIDSFDGASNADTGKALFTALSTEFSEAMLIEAVEFWRNRRKNNPRSLILFVVPRISHAERVQRFLKKMGLNVGIATSDEDDPQSVIDRFRQKEQPYLDGLVTVAMAYEGMDVPQADVLVCLTHIRSPEWIEQMIHRVTRFDRHNKLPWGQQWATIFAPKDKFFIDIMKRIKLEQAPFVVDEPMGTPPKQPPKSQSTTTPKQSEVTGRSAHTFDDVPVVPDVYNLVTDALKEADIHGAISTTAAKRFFDAM